MTVRLAAIGTHLPPRRESNEGPARVFGVDERFLTEKIGVAARAVKEPGQRTSDLCLAAFAALAEHTAVDLAEVRMLCVVTQNPDTRIPHTAAVLHERLGLARHCMTFDLSQGCAGYVHGLATAVALAERFGFAHSLLFTCDPYSRIVDPADRNTALLFGDGATASYLTAHAPGYRLADADFGTAPGSSSVLRCEDRLVMEGREVFLHAAREAPVSIRALLTRNGLGTDDVDEFLLHPGSRRMVDVLRKAIGVGEDRLPFEMAGYGNTVSSSIPLMLATRLDGSPPRTVLMSGFGVGFCWGSGLLVRDT